MNHHHLTYLSQHLSLGHPLQESERVYGGLLHLMWELKTDKGHYAIKQLSKNINVADSKIVKNYDLSEQIAACFATQDIPAVYAISKASKSLFILDGTGYLVYPWVDAKILSAQEEKGNRALEIARLLAKMHHINLQIEGMEEVNIDVHDNESITGLIQQSRLQPLSFYDALNIHLPTLLEMNKNYFASVESLNKYTVVSHGDLDQKNVLWDAHHQPFFIDWESARKVNPTYDIINVALDWSNIATHFNTDLFHHILRAYKKAGGLMDNSIMEAALYGVMGNWLNWMIYNINRALNPDNAEQKKIGIEQVNHALALILRIKRLMPELMGRT